MVVPFSLHSLVSPSAQAIDPPSMDRHFGGPDGLLPLWIAEPYLDLPPPVIKSLTSRAGTGWYGYETRSENLAKSFWTWMSSRHGWDEGELKTIVSPSVGTALGVLIHKRTKPGDEVILQPPVFTDFKPLVTTAGRTVVRNALALTDDGYQMDLEDLEAKAANPTTTALVLCNPHNPVGRVWTAAELTALAKICASHGVFVIADEIHADIVLGSHTFTPFSKAAAGIDVSWAALHGPIKTFGLAGVCDTLVISNNQEVMDQFDSVSSQLHITRNNVFGLAAFEAAYSQGAPWFDDMLKLIETNASVLREQLPEGIDLVDLEGTYLAWLDFRQLGLAVPELAKWLATSARLGLSPGHWFGREGAGFARMTIAAPTAMIEEAASRLGSAVKKTDAIKKEGS